MRENSLFSLTLLDSFAPLGRVIVEKRDLKKKSVGVNPTLFFNSGFLRDATQGFCKEISDLSKDSAIRKMTSNNQTYPTEPHRYERFPKEGLDRRIELKFRHENTFAAYKHSGKHTDRNAGRKPSQRYLKFRFLRFFYG